MNAENEVLRQEHSTNTALQITISVSGNKNNNKVESAMAMNRKELNELMQDSAKNAVDTTREEFGIHLDHTAESIKFVDTVILKWIERYKDRVLEDKAVFTLCNIYGAYVGEVFRNVVGGEWTYDESNPDAPYVLLEYGTRSYAFAGVCYQRLVHDSQVSIEYYFSKAISNNTQ